MKTVVGVFTQYQDAEYAAARLYAEGVPGDRINVLAPGTSEADSVPTTDTEQSGTGAAIGGVVGAAAGAAGGLSLASATVMIPGVGPVIAAGVVAAAILGMGGAVGGAAVGAALEEHLATGIPKDELALYQSALHQGRTVVVAFVDDEEDAANARRTLNKCGAESLDPAGHDPWIGLGEAHYEGK